jgi:hypothetical protein
MRKLREVLRLRYELKLGYQQIGEVARSGSARSQVPEARRGGGRHLATARGLG